MFLFVLVPVIAVAWRALVVAGALGAVVLVGNAHDRPGEQPFADNPRVVEAADPLSDAEARRAGWPTGRRDSGPSGFSLFLGADLVWPTWVACEDRLCLAGVGDDIYLYDTFPKFARVGRIDASLGENPFDKLVASTVTEEQARRLLTP